MSSLFGNLPAPKRKPEPFIEEQNKRIRDGRSIGSPSPVEKLEQAVNAEEERDPANEQDAHSSNQDQIAIAIAKIANHIGQNSKKFIKSSELLRQILEGDDVDAKKHGSLIFSALAASMVDPHRSSDPMLGREYYKLFSLSSSRLELFSDQEQLRLKVYDLWAVIRWKIVTADDSFEFSRTIQQVRSLINDLSSISPAERDRLQDINLEKLFYKPDWDDVDLAIARRLAVIDCLLATKSTYKRAWASTAIDMLIEMASSDKDKFLDMPTFPKLEQLFHSIKEQKLARSTGSSRVAQDGDSTAFERARKEWSRASVSHRGKIGGGGDHKSEAWLG